MNTNSPPFIPFSITCTTTNSDAAAMKVSCIVGNTDDRYRNTIVRLVSSAEVVMSRVLPLICSCSTSGRT